MSDFDIVTRIAIASSGTLVALTIVAVINGIDNHSLIATAIGSFGYQFIDYIIYEIRH